MGKYDKNGWREATTAEWATRTPKESTGIALQLSVEQNRGEDFWQTPEGSAALEIIQKGLNAIGEKLEKNAKKYQIN